MDTIGLITAMHSENKALLRHIRGWKRITLGMFHGIRFQITNRDCVLVISGMGSWRAAKAARAMIQAFHPICLVSFGIAGAVRDDLKIGDVVMVTLNGILERGIVCQFNPILPLSPIAQEAIERSLRSCQARLLPGTAVTTRGSQWILQQPQELLNPILEMETAGILQATRESGIPLVALRSVSDGPQAPIPFDIETVMDDEYNIRPGRLLQAVLKQPRLLLQSNQMIRNSRIAADHAAIAVAAILDLCGSLLSA